MNYKEYELSFGEKIIVFVKALALVGAIAFLFYRSMWAVLLAPFLYIFLHKKAKRSGKEQREQLLQDQFVSGMRVLNASLQAGLSMENSWREVEKETRIMYGEESLFYQEIKEINQSVALNIPIEKLFLEFANRTGIEDIISFAEIFDYGKRSGGNWKKIIDTTVYRISERYEAKKQIEIMVAEKRMEQQVMNVIPLAILGFLQISSWDYMKVLYHNPLGIICMTVCLVGYGFAIGLSEKILRIQV